MLHAVSQSQQNIEPERYKDATRQQADKSLYSYQNHMFVWTCESGSYEAEKTTRGAFCEFWYIVAMILKHRTQNGLNRACGNIGIFAIRWN